MIRQRENIIWYKVNGLLRLGLYKGLGRPFGAGIVVNEYPKSGGSWLAQMLAEALELPFPRNRLPMLGRCILHGHYLSHTPLEKPVVMFRDGRDVAVSFYYHSIVGNELTRMTTVMERRKLLKIDDPQDIGHNLPRFLEQGFATHKFSRFTWAEFIERWYRDPDAIQVKYEDIHSDCAKILQSVVEQTTGQPFSSQRAEEIARKYSFKSLAKREQGVESTKKYLRKGIVGDWQNHFTKEAAQIFNRIAGEALIAAGYEADESWIESARSLRRIREKPAK